MNKAVRIVILAVGLGVAFAAVASAGILKIDPAGYTGAWSIDYGPPHKGPAGVQLGPVDPVVHAHVISIGGAEIFFTVGWHGLVSVTPSAAAEGGVGSVTFNTTTVRVDPVLFDGHWRIVAGATPDLTGVQNVTLVRGLSFYNLEVGATGGFSFDVAADGTVTVRNPLAARGGANALTLNLTERFSR